MTSSGSAVAAQCDPPVAEDEVQRRIQAMLDQSKTDADLLESLKGQGKVGRILSDYISYILRREDRDARAEFEERNIARQSDYVINETVLRMATMMEQRDTAMLNYHYLQLVALNKRFCLFERDGYVMNMLKIAYLSRQSSREQVQQDSLEAHRWIVFHDNDAYYEKRYIDLLGKSEPALFEREADFWTAKLKVPVCPDRGNRDQCVTAMLAKVREQTPFEGSHSMEVALCTALVIDEDRVLRFRTCD